MAPGRSRRKLCYILPAYSPSIAEHYGHVPRLLEEIARLCDLAVVVERPGGRLRIPGAKVIHQRARRWPWRFIELLGILWRLNSQGYKRVFVRISTPAALAAGIVRRIRGGRVVVWRSGPRIGADMGQLFFLLVLRLVDKLATGPKAMVKRMCADWALAEVKVCLLANDVDTDLYVPDPEKREHIRTALGIAEDEVVVLSVGRISRVRRMPRYIPGAWLEPAREGARFVLVGGGDELWEIMRATERVGLKSATIFTGELPQLMVRGIYYAGDVFFLASGAEGFPRVVLEAMAMGLAVVATDVGGVKEILPPEQRRFVMPADDVDGLGRALRVLVQDEALRRRLGKANRQWVVENYDTRVVARMYVDKLLGEGECGA